MNINHDTFIYETRCDCMELLNLHLQDKVRDDLPTHFSLEWMWGKWNHL